MDAETADGNVNLLLTDQGALPSVSSLEEKVRPLLSGRSIELKVINSQTFPIVPQPHLNQG